MTLIDALLDRILGRPTLDTVTIMACAALAEHGATQVRVEPDAQQLRFALDGCHASVSLRGLLAHVSAWPRRQRRQQVWRFLSMGLQTELPKGFQEAQDRLRPVIRTEAEMALNAMQLRTMQADGPLQLPVHAPFAPGLRVVLALDYPDSMAHVTDHMLADWGITFETALNCAMDNLRQMPGDGGWQRMGPGVWMGAWGDSYEPSRLLMPDMIYRLGVSRPVALAPFRDCLMVTDAANQAGMQVMTQFTLDSLDGDVRWLSFELLALVEGHWTLHDEQPPGMRIAALRARSDDHQSQKEWLKSALAAQGEEVFIASFMAATTPEQTGVSYAAWTLDCDSLLPCADWIAFVDTQTQHVVQLPWSEVMTHFGHLLEKTTHVPTLYRARTSPSMEAVQEVARKLADR